MDAGALVGEDALHQPGSDGFDAIGEDIVDALYLGFTLRRHASQEHVREDHARVDGSDLNRQTGGFGDEGLGEEGDGALDVL